jgi:uncharacterized membrane protein (UPF0182 family)
VLGRVRGAGPHLHRPFFAICWTNLFIADRIAPVFRPPGPEEDLLEPYHVFIARRMRIARVLVALLFAVIAGAGASSQWNDWILFNNRVDFGIEDPQFHRDIGFYVFELPFLSFIVNWLFFSFVMILLITAVAHYLNGGIRLQTTGERVTPQVKAHLSLLLGVLALIKVADYYLARFELTTSSRGVVDGATYTDVKVQLPALNLLMAISLLSFVLLIINIRRRGWQLPAVTVGLWAFVAIVAGNIYPAFVQRFSVDPAESSKERPYVERNIEFTRQAYGLDAVETAPFDYRQDLTADDVAADINNVRSARILDPEAMRGAFQLEQGKRTYYRFASQLDIDRYEINNRQTEVVIGARELNPSDRDGWENAHLAYTHGNGVALAPASKSTTRTPLVPRERDTAPRELGGQTAKPVTLARPQIYGENLGELRSSAPSAARSSYTDEDERVSTATRDKAASSSARSCGAPRSPSGSARSSRSSPTSSARTRVSSTSATSSTASRRSPRSSSGTPIPTPCCSTARSCTSSTDTRRRTGTPTPRTAAVGAGRSPGAASTTCATR